MVFDSEGVTNFSLRKWVALGWAASGNANRNKTASQAREHFAAHLDCTRLRRRQECQRKRLPRRRDRRKIATNDREGKAILRHPRNVEKQTPFKGPLAKSSHYQELTPCRSGISGNGEQEQSHAQSRGAGGDVWREA